MKMQIQFQRITMAMVLSLALVMGSCRKKEETPEPTETADTEQSSVDDNNKAENYAADIESMGSEISENGTLVSYKGAGEQGEYEIAASPCATVTGIGTGSVTVDFGTTGCIGFDGRTRTGKLIFTYATSSSSTTLYYRNPGFSMSVASQNYVVDNHSVTIVNKTVSNTTPSNIPTGVNPGTNLTWAITASLSIAKPGGGTISWSCSRTKELMNTSDTICYRGQSKIINWSKAIVKLNGTASGVNAQNENYTVVATNLIRDFNCSPYPLQSKKHPFIGGTISYTPGIRFTRLINYGDGVTCDVNATLTINGNTYNIVLN